MSKDFQWYERNKPHKYGEYDSSTKLYFNEDSGKWVTQLRDKNRVIEEKYIRYEFSVWDDRQIEEEFGYALVERINRFLYLLFKKTLEIERTKGHRWVYVDSSRICCGILGMGYKEIIQKLYDFDIIDLKYGIGKFGNDRQMYQLNEAFFGKDCQRREVYIRNTKLTKFLDKMYSGKLSLGDKRDELINWEIESCKRVNLHWDEDGVSKLLIRRLNKRKDLEFEKKDWDFLSNKERVKINEGWDDKKEDDLIWNGRLSFEQLRVELDELKNGGFSFNSFSRDDFSGRYYNIFNTKQREFRTTMKMDGEKLIEVDMVNGYVALFYRVLRGINELPKGESRFDDYLRKVVGDIDVSDFLEKYRSCFDGDNENRFDFYDFIGVQLLEFGAVEEFGEEYKRAYMKELVMYLINGEKGDGLRKTYLNGRYTYDEIMEQIFCKGGYEAIERIKNTDLSFKRNNSKQNYGYKRYVNMSKVLMNMENIIMKGIWLRLIELKIPYISLFDGMMVKKSDLKIVLEVADQHLKGINNSIRLKVK